MKKAIRYGCFETNSSSAHTVTFKMSADTPKYPCELCIDQARFDYCGDTVSGHEAKANYLWDIIMQHSSNHKWIMRFINYLAAAGITVTFNPDWIENGDTWYESNLPYDSEGEQLLIDYLECQSSLLEFLFNDDLIVELYEG